MNLGCLSSVSQCWSKEGDILSVEVRLPYIYMKTFLSRIVSRMPHRRRAISADWRAFALSGSAVLVFVVLLLGVSSMRNAPAAVPFQEVQPGQVSSASHTKNPIPQGRQVYQITMASHSPNITEAVVDPVDVHPGDTQFMSVAVSDTDSKNKIVSVVAAVRTDTGIKEYPLSLSSGSAESGVWSGSWMVHDTHSETYRTTFVATNDIGEIASTTLTWTDPCAPPPGGNWTLDANCTIAPSVVDGVDNGNFILNNAAYTLTVNGTFAWSNSIQLTAGAIAIAFGSGGTGCTSTAWTCTIVDDPANSVGAYTSIAFDPSGNAWVSYQDNTAFSLKVAKYVGSGGTGCTSTAWTCTIVDDSANNVGYYTSIAFDPSGNAWVSYQDNTALSLKVTKYVGSGGTGCTSTAWTCTIVDDPANSVGVQNSIAFDPSGNAWVSYYDSTARSLKVTKYVGSGGTGCTSTAWTCTIVDDPANIVGVFTSIAFDPSGNAWVSYRDFTADSLKVTKYVGSGGTGCTSTAWTCTIVDDPANAVGWDTSIAFDPSGNAWVSYSDYTALALKVAKYVGSGGTGCTSTAWTCTIVDDPANSVGVFTSIAFDPSGNAWVSYRDFTANSLKVTKYVGSGGTGCTSTAWTCTIVDDSANNVGHYTSIAFDPSGNAWVSYYDSTALSLKVTKYVGSGGTGGVLLNTNLWVMNQDADGYPAVANPAQVAQDTSPGATYSRRYVLNTISSADCYDSNASAYPGQTAWFTGNRGDGSFDYNCDGVTNSIASGAWLGYDTACVVQPVVNSHPYTSLAVAGCPVGLTSVSTSLGKNVADTVFCDGNTWYEWLSSLTNVTVYMCRNQTGSTLYR